MNAIHRSRLRSDPDSIGALVTAATFTNDRYREGDEGVDLTEEQIVRAKRAYETGGISYGTALRRSRQPHNPLLCIYPISANSNLTQESHRRQNLFDPSQIARPVIGLSISFPYSQNAVGDTRIGGPKADPRS